MRFGADVNQDLQASSDEFSPDVLEELLLRALVAGFVFAASAWYCSCMTNMTMVNSGLRADCMCIGLSFLHDEFRAECVEDCIVNCMFV